MYTKQTLISAEIPVSVTHLLRKMARPYKAKSVLFFGLTFFAVLSWSASPVMIARIVTELSATRTVTSTIWWLVTGYAVLRILDEILWRLAEAVMRIYKPQMVESVRQNLFAATLKRQYAFFVNASSGRIGHWINRATDTTNELVDTTIWNVWPRLLGLSISAVFLFVAHWSLGLLFLAWLVGLFSYNVYRGKRFGKLITIQSDETSKASGLIVDSIGNHLSVRVFNAQDREVQSLDSQQQRIIRSWRNAWWQSLGTNSAKGLSAAIASAVALLLVIGLYAGGIVQIGSIVLFIAYFGDASSSLWDLAWALDAYYRHFGTIQNSLDGLSGDDERRVARSNHEQNPATVSLELKNLSFVYPDHDDVRVIRGLDLKIKAGEKVGVVGHSGAGKSTLVGLLLGFYEPTSGDIVVNGNSLAEHDPSFIRNISSYVPQDTNLFNRTVAENIRYAKPDATDSELEQALKRSQAYDFVHKLDKGVDTIIGERGVKLSGGQRQRIAIARAIIQNAPLLLLDEATSALDSVSEQAIQKALHELMQDRTTLVIAHRLSTLRHLDKIVVLDKGQIAEQGSHDELIKHNGIYADLWKRQKDGFIVD